MKKGFNRQFKLPNCEIFAGEYFVTREPKIVISTLLGSCVSVCMKDINTGIAGMNHFMLPNAVKRDEVILSEAGRYGLYAMELMINDMLKLGGHRDFLRAKVFGGGRILNTQLNTVSDSNVSFALSFLEMEGIHVLSHDIGGQTGRRVFFVPEDFSVYVKKIAKVTQLNATISEEKRYLQSIRQKQTASGEVELFE